MKSVIDPGVDITRSTLLRHTKGGTDKSYRLEIQTKILTGGTRVYSAVSAYYVRGQKITTRTVMSGWSKSLPATLEAYATRRDLKLSKGCQVIEQDQTYPIGIEGQQALAPADTRNTDDRPSKRSAQLRACYADMARAAPAGFF